MCLDTAHAVAADYRLGRQAEVGCFLDRMQGLLGLERMWGCGIF
ncbi:hypothetical protein DFAR_3460010 [Desulfarculales bacterium]